MAEERRKVDPDFQDGAVRIVHDSGRPLAEVACEMAVPAGSHGNWFAKAIRSTPAAPWRRTSARSRCGCDARSGSCAWR